MGNNSPVIRFPWIVVILWFAMKTNVDNGWTLGSWKKMPAIWRMLNKKANWDVDKILIT